MKKKRKIKNAENDVAKNVPEMKFPLQMDSAKLDFGGNSKIRAEKIVMRDTKTGEIYGSRVVMQKVTETLIGELLAMVESEGDGSFPAVVIGEIKSNIRKGAKDLEQGWSNALELVNKAFEVAQVRIPTPIDAAKWKQYESLIQFGVAQLAATRGSNGKWRMTQSMVSESSEQLSEARIFVHVPGLTEIEVDAKNIDDVVVYITDSLRTKNLTAVVESKDKTQAVINILRGDEKLETITIRNIS